MDNQWGRFELSTNVVAEHASVCIIDATDRQIEPIIPQVRTPTMLPVSQVSETQKTGVLLRAPCVLVFTSVGQVATVVNMQANYKNPSLTVRNNPREGGEKR